MGTTATVRTDGAHTTMPATTSSASMRTIAIGLLACLSGCATDASVPAPASGGAIDDCAPTGAADRRREDDHADAVALVDAGVDAFAHSVRDQVVSDALVAAMVHRGVYFMALSGAEARHRPARRCCRCRTQPSRPRWWRCATRNGRATGRSCKRRATTSRC